MSKYCLLSLIAIVLSVVAARADVSQPKFVPGQEWSIKSPSSTGIKVIIGHIGSWHNKVVINVSVLDVPAPGGSPNSEPFINIGHMPFEESALLASVDKVIANDIPPIPAFEEGYKQWRNDQNAGVFTIGVPEAVQLVLKTLEPDHKQL